MGNFGIHIDEVKRIASRLSDRKIDLDKIEINASETLGNLPNIISVSSDGNYDLDAVLRRLNDAITDSNKKVKSLFDRTIGFINEQMSGYEADNQEATTDFSNIQASLDNLR